MSSKESSLEKARVTVLAKKGTPGDDNSPRSSMGAEVDKPISDVELLRIMECPVCNEFPAPPIYSCEKGHFTCNSCMRLLDNCSLCEGPFTNVRNFALESIIENSKFKCRNAQLGCELIVSGAELNQHVANCLFRPLECQEPDCFRSDLNPKEYFNHIVDNHGAVGCTREMLDGKAVVTLTQKEDCEINSPYYVRIGLPENKDTCTILIFSKRYRTFMCWWASCLEPKMLAEYEISLSLDNNADSDNMSVRWKVPLQPIWKGFDEVRDTGRCAVLPDTHLFAFTDKDHWNLKVEIVKKDFECTHFQHYYPLLLLVLVGIIAVISSYFMDSASNWFHSTNPDNFEFNQTFGKSDEAANQKDFGEEYIGYRGFYYKAD